jgi:hypothetical protein
MTHWLINTSDLTAGVELYIDIDIFLEEENQARKGLRCGGRVEC